jgi:VWFA-related protein
MRHLFRLCVVLFPCGAFLFAPAALPQDTVPKSPDIRVTVDRVNVGVIVTDQHGNFVGGLQRGNFQVFDDGVEQPITDFFNVNEPAQVLLLIEAGPAVYLLEGGHLQAIHSLLNGLSPGDRIAIARYDESAEPILGFTSDKLAAAGILDQLHFNLGFGQLNLAASLATALDWVTRVPGKKSLVLLSTGVDTSPPAAAETLLARLKSTDVRVLAVSLGGELRSANPTGRKRSRKDQVLPEKEQAAAEGFAQADEELQAIAQANGGRVYFPATSKDFTEVFAQIAQLVRHEYSLGFAPRTHDGKVHSIEVRVTEPAKMKSSLGGQSSPAQASYRVDHRQAYIAPAPPAT